MITEYAIREIAKRVLEVHANETEGGTRSIPMDKLEIAIAKEIHDWLVDDQGLESDPISEDEEDV